MSPERDPFEAAYGRLASARLAPHPGGAAAPTVPPATSSVAAGAGASRLLPRLAALPPGARAGQKPRLP